MCYLPQPQRQQVLIFICKQTEKSTINEYQKEKSKKKFFLGNTDLGMDVSQHK